MAMRGIRKNYGGHPFESSDCSERMSNTPCFPRLRRAAGSPGAQKPHGSEASGSLGVFSGFLVGLVVVVLRLLSFQLV